MCGIAGFSYKTTHEAIENITLAKRLLEKRGPDGSGHSFDERENFAFVHTRLAIIDKSSAGDQPMRDHTGRFILTYNGEIYNHEKLRHKLELLNPNINWQGRSDSETLVEFLAHFGVEVGITYLDGMFAFSFYDTKSKKLWLARDRFGEKPLYWSLYNNHLSFSSCLDVLVATKNLPTVLSQKSIQHFITQGFIGGTNTIYKNAKKLAPSTIAVFKIQLGATKLIEETRWKSKFETNKVSLNNRVNIEADIRSELVSSVSSRLISDIPVGIMLSGGVDSSLIAAIAANELDIKVDTFTLGFENSGRDETAMTAKLTKKLGLKNFVCSVTKLDLMNTMDELGKSYSEPFADPSALPTLILARHISQNCRVTLSGDGGDELFRGYSRYLLGYKVWQLLKKQPNLSRLLLGGLITTANRSINLTNILLNFLSHEATLYENVKLEKLQSLLEADNVSDYFHNLVGPCLAPEIGLPKSVDEEIRWLQNADVLTFLPDSVLTKVDRAAMNFSLETRSPFLNPRLYEMVKFLPENRLSRGTVGKILLREYLSDLVGENFQPSRQKLGFEASIRTLLKTDKAQTLLSDAKNCLELIEVIKRMKAKGLGTDNDFIKWRMICYMAWKHHRHYLNV